MFVPPYCRIIMSLVVIGQEYLFSFIVMFDLDQGHSNSITIA